MGRLAVLRAWLDVRGESQLEYVHADCVGNGDGISLQRSRGDFPATLSCHVSRDGRRVAGLLRSRGGDHDFGLARTSSGIARAQPHIRGDPFPAAAGTEKCAAGARRWHRAGCAARTYTGRRHAARASGRKSAGGWSRHRWRKFGGRIADDGRADSGGKICRGAGDRWNDQRNGHAGDASRAGGQRNASGADRAHGERGAAQPRAGAKACRSRGWIFCSGGGADRGPHLCGVGDFRAAAAHGPRFVERCRGADYCVSVCAGTGDADGDHGGHRTRRAGRRPSKECGSAGDAGKSGHGCGG